MYIDLRNIILVKHTEKEITDTDIDKDVIQFFKDNPNPPDEGEGSVHEWADKNNYDKHEVEETIYKLMSVFVEFLVNGRANEKDITEKDVDSEELKMGIEIEYEHTTDMETSKRIALDHLAEFGDYYTRLKKMEKEAEEAEGVEETEETEETKE